MVSVEKLDVIVIFAPLYITVSFKNFSLCLVFLNLNMIYPGVFFLVSVFIFHLSFISLDLHGKEQCDEKGDEVTKDSSPSRVLIPLTGYKGLGGLCLP